MKIDSVLKKIDKNFLNGIILNNTRTVSVLTSKGCGSCYLSSSILKKLSADFSTSVLFFEVDIDDEHLNVSDLGFSELPIILFAKGEDICDALYGIHSQADIREKIINLLKEPAL
ncbi:MAG: thioredoxin domain-containing protein [Bacteroidota bacterium]